mmetsp:Transcript_5574/g.16815  ORF Transcript_5574/g.16815 Transcript_5574/m.16815 type:complete len:98 (-) Transcript_5574:236-529(-)
MARLRSVEVQANDFLGVEPYIVDDLVIVSNQRSEEFLDFFSDPAIRQHVDPLWPNKFPVSMTNFDGNLLCQFQRWKLQKHADVVRDFFADVGVSSRA